MDVESHEILLRADPARRNRQIARTSSPRIYGGWRHAEVAGLRQVYGLRKKNGRAQRLGNDLKTVVNSICSYQHHREASEDASAGCGG